MNEGELSLKRSTTDTSQIGEKLRYARESRGLSQQEVSRALCLSVAIIDALERDAHEELPAPVFIKGYLKNYADFLRLPLSPEDIRIQTTVKHTQNYHQKPPKSSMISILSVITHLFMKILNYIIFPILLLLIFLWWHEKHHAADKAVSIADTKANVVLEKNPFPRIHSRPIPPDITPWLDDAGGAQ